MPLSEYLEETGLILRLSRLLKYLLNQPRLPQIHELLYELSWCVLNYSSEDCSVTNLITKSEHELLKIMGQLLEVCPDTINHNILWSLFNILAEKNEEKTK